MITTKPNYSVEAKHWQVNEITLAHHILTFSDHDGFNSTNDSDLVRLHFGLKGDYRFIYKQLNQSFDLIGGHHNLMYSNGLDLEVRNKTLVLETFGVNFPKKQFVLFTQNSDDQLKRFTEQIMEGRDVIFSDQWGSLDTSIQGVIDEILINRYAGHLRDVFHLAKSLELLVLCVDHYQRTVNRTFTVLKTKQDKEKVIAARDYINEHFMSPPNLSDIAKAVGLNEYKLKRGFKEMFHHTVFGYLIERRLTLAMQYLRDTQKTAAEISFELGYSSPQHFSSQFRKKFGIPPNSVRKNP